MPDSVDMAFCEISKRGIRIYCAEHGTSKNKRKKKQKNFRDTLITNKRSKILRKNAKILSPECDRKI